MGSVNVLYLLHMTENIQPSQPYKKLYRSTDNKMITGLLGGLGEFFDIDPTLLRLVFAFFVVFTALVPGTLLYFISSWIVPKKKQ